MLDPASPPCRRLAVLALLVPFAAGCSDAGAGAAPALSFSAIPYQDETELRAKFEPVARHLAAELDVPVEYVPATRYEDAVDLFEAGDVQLAWFGGLTGVQARAAVSGARAIAQGAEDRAYRSYFIAHRDTGLERGEEFPMGLEGRTFTFGSPSSTSGRLMAEHFIREHTGMAPAEFFGGDEMHFSGNHDNTVQLVQDGAFEAGAVDFDVYEERVAEGVTDPEVCRVIWETPTYPDYNFTAHPSLDETFGEGFTDRLQQVLVRMDDPDLLAAFGRSTLVPASNEDYEELHELAAALGFVRP